MCDQELLLAQFVQIKDAIYLIQNRMNEIETPDDFVHTPEGVVILDSICIRLMAIGETVKNIDKSTQGNFLPQFSEIDWKAIKGMRDLLAHRYFDVDEDEIFKTITEDLPKLLITIQKIIELLPSTPLPSAPLTEQ